MTGNHDFAQGLTQFQLQGDAAERYERWVVPIVTGPWVPGLLDLAELRAGQHVLDVATGTGVVARLAARRVTPNGPVTSVYLHEGKLQAPPEFPVPPRIPIHRRGRRPPAPAFSTRHVH